MTTAPGLRSCGIRFLAAAAVPALVIASGMIGNGLAFAESTPADSFGNQSARTETTQPVHAPAPSPADPPKDVLHGASGNITPTTNSASARIAYRGLIEKEASQQGLAPEIAEAVMAVESGYDPASIGSAGEIGLMQIMPTTARMLGFNGTLAELAEPAVNIHYGVLYLAQAWRLAGGDLCTAAMKYRAGHGETRFSVLSVRYCVAVRARLAARGFPVTGGVPVATFGDPAGSGCGRKCVGIARAGKTDLAALNSQLSALVVRVRGGR